MNCIPYNVYCFQNKGCVQEQLSGEHKGGPKARIDERVEREREVHDDEERERLDGARAVRRQAMRMVLPLCQAHGIPLAHREEPQDEHGYEGFAPVRSPEIVGTVVGQVTRI